jgi:hypothetical protein
LLSIMTFIISGCAAKEHATSQLQKHDKITRQMHASYNDSYDVVLNVLKRQDYEVNKQDREHGLIAAHLAQETSKSSQFWQSFWWGYVPHKKTLIEVTVRVQKLTEILQELQMQIQQDKYNEYGGRTDILLVSEATPYDALFQAIATEIERSATSR